MYATHNKYLIKCSLLPLVVVVAVAVIIITIIDISVIFGA